MPPTRKLIGLGAVVAVAVSGIALTETAPGDHPMDHVQQHSIPSGQHPMGPGHIKEMMRQHQGMMAGQAGMHGASTTPTLPGQGAFGAIQEVSVFWTLTRRPTGRRSTSKHCASISSI